MEWNGQSHQREEMSSEQRAGRRGLCRRGTPDQTGGRRDGRDETLKNHLPGNDLGMPGSSLPPGSDTGGGSRSLFRRYRISNIRPLTPMIINASIVLNPSLIKSSSHHVIMASG
jgi:hypothetical protein